MGQLTTALKATKELRKQFLKLKAVKKISKRDQKIIDAIENSDFSCQKENAYIFAEALIERKIPREKGKNEETFNGVLGSLLCYTSETTNEENKGVFVIDEWVDRSEVYWYGPKSGNTRSLSRQWDKWRPATDKEIREYFS